MKESHASLYTHHNSHVPFKRALNTFKYQSPLFELSLILLNSNIVLSVYLFVEENIVLVIIYNLLKGHCINSLRRSFSYQLKGSGIKEKEEVRHALKSRCRHRFLNHYKYFILHSSRILLLYLS